VVKRFSKYLVFKIENEFFGLPMSVIKEVHSFIKVKSLEKKEPGFIRGILNLRGKAIPILDLRAKLNRNEVVFDEQTVFIILQPDKISGFVYAVAVDALDDVISVASDSIQYFNTENLEEKFACGFCKDGNKLFLIIDTDKLLTVYDYEHIENILVKLNTLQLNSIKFDAVLSLVKDDIIDYESYMDSIGNS